MTGGRGSEIPPTITSLDRQLLRLLVVGHTVRSAANILHISTRTAEAALAALRDMTGSPSLYALGAYAERLGWHK